MLYVRLTDILLGTAKIPAGGMKKLMLGSYRQTHPLPQLCVEIDSDLPGKVRFKRINL